MNDDDAPAAPHDLLDPGTTLVVGPTLDGDIDLLRDAETVT